MSRRSALIASVLLVIFGVVVLTVQLGDFGSDQAAAGKVVRSFGGGSIVGTYNKARNLAQLASIVDRDGGMNRRLDLVLPEDARIFMTGMTGATNGGRNGLYYYLTYYVFPRDVEVTLAPPVFTQAGIEGPTTESDEVMQAHGFDARADIAPDGTLTVNGWTGTARPLRNPDWFDSWADTLRAFLLPLLTAISGAGLLRLIFGGELGARLTTFERLACGLGLGMMAVAAVTLGVKLCGFHGRGLVMALAVIGSVYEVRRARVGLQSRVAASFRAWFAGPVAGILTLAGLAVFLILFRLAALQGIAEFDAVADWLFKAKILFLSTGHEIGDWIANPRLVYDRPDYPTLVPSLHAATYDSLGHVNELVTKFWPVWMLLFLAAALASLVNGGAGRFQAPFFFCLGMVLLPFTQCYAQMEGATLPMTFFTVLGLVQCALAWLEEDRPRLGLGLTLLFGATMTKFEGGIFLALAAAGFLLVPATRRLVKWDSHWWRGAAFCGFAALPFLGMRAEMRVVHYFDSGWFGYLLAKPVIALASAPKLFGILLARMFLASDFAHWSGAEGRLHWTGHWHGPSSLYNHLTLGLPWLCLLLTILLGLAAPRRRTILLWITGVFFSVMAALSVIFASFVGLSGLDQVITEWTADDVAGRYLFPVLFAWAAVLVIVAFRNAPLRTPVSES